MGMSDGVRKLCLAYDVEGYSGRGTRGEYGAQRRLVEVLECALGDADLKLTDCHLQPQGDGGLALLPTGGEVNEPRLLVSILNALEHRLAEVNEDLRAAARIRLRVALHQGVVHVAAHGYVGPAVIEVCRLRDCDAARARLAANPAADLVVVAADGIYRDVLAHGYHGLPGSAFVPIVVRAKAFVGDAWVYVPTPREPARTLAAEPPTAPTSEAGARGPLAEPDTTSVLRDIVGPGFDTEVF